MSLSTSGQQSINYITVKQIASHAEQSATTAGRHGHRAFLLFECAHNDDTSTLRQWFDDLPEKRRLWLPEQTRVDRTDQIQKLLGTESTLVVYDATQGVDPRLLAASAGTLAAGGLYLLLSPPLEHWANSFDQEYGTSHSVFLQRLAQHFRQQCVPSPIHNLWHFAPPAAQSRQTKQSLPGLLTEQNEILELLLADIEARRPRVLVIQADRGRGKSTLLARALIDSRTPTTTSVTALHNSATTVLQQYCLEHGHRVQTMPLQQALLQTHDCLLVDEAATIPIDQLLKLASRSKQIVFATTVDGYEGAGRGFAIRFAKQLDTHYVGWRLYQPINPIRWQAGDAVEALFNSALLLKSDLPPAPAIIKLDEISCKPHSPIQLIQNPQLLEHAFAILARAHYQTTAMDLRHMLDSPGMSVWIASINGAPVAAALVCTEGEIDGDLYTDIAHKKRRLKHQLLPQLLTQFTLSDNLLTQRYQRIVRIAVVPTIQGRGIGSILAQEIINNSNKGHNKADAIGTSFGADDATLGFWLKQGLVPVHLGYKRNPRSGLPAACMLLAHSDTVKAAQLSAQLLLRHNLELLQQASTNNANANQTAEPSQYSRLIDIFVSRPQPSQVNDDPLAETLKLQCKLFAANERHFLDSLAAVHALIDSKQPPKNQTAARLFEELAHNIIADVNKPMRTQNREMAKEVQELLR